MKAEAFVTTSLPPIDPHPGMDTHQDYGKLYKLVDKARNDLAKHWPNSQQCGEYRILISPIQDVAVKSSYIRGTSPKLNHILFFGIEALNSTFIQTLLGDKVTEEQATLLLLGHETFHLSQAARMMKCEIDAVLQNSGFAQGIEIDMQCEWKHCAASLAAHFPTRSDMPIDVMRASDIVSELRADIRSLNIAKQLGLDIAKLGKAMQKSRASDELNNPNAYKISKEMKTLLDAGLPSERDAVPMLWKMALDILAPLPDTQELSVAIGKARKRLSYTAISRVRNAVSFKK